MAERPHLHFGDRETSDVILHLTNPDGSEYHGNPLFLHSNVLGKSGFFEAMLSERWSSTIRPFELKIGIRHDVNRYLKCIQFMYLSEVQKRRYLTGVEETLGILEVASEFMIKECMEACMEYLEAVRWTLEEKLQITGLISSLQLKPSSDLAARLGISELSYDREIGKEVGSLMSSVSTDETVRDMTVNLLFLNFDADTNPARADEMASALCSGLRSNLEVIMSQLKNARNTHMNTVQTNIRAASSALLWLLKHLQRLRMLEPAVKLFAEYQNGLIDALRRDDRYLFVDALFTILITLFHALGNGEVICSRAVRLSFIAAWWPVIQGFRRKDWVTSHWYSPLGPSTLDQDVVKEMLGVVQTLPLVDRAQVVQIYKEGCLNTSPPLNSNLSSAMDLCCNELRRLLLRSEESS